MAKYILSKVVYLKLGGGIKPILHMFMILKDLHSLFLVKVLVSRYISLLFKKKKNQNHEFPCVCIDIWKKSQNLLMMNHTV